MNLSLILMCWNTSHLLDRTLFTLQQQTVNNWELIIIDDNSEDDVPAVLEKYPSLPIRHFRLEHAMGMRGNVVSINYGVRKARGKVVMWSTPEVMLPPGALQTAHDTVINSLDYPAWVTVPSHGLALGAQLAIDTVDWKGDLNNIKALVDVLPEDDWDSKWFYHNFYEGGIRTGEIKTGFGHNQTVAVDREHWVATVGHFPFFLDYGCLAGDTRVLTADLQWVRNDSVKVGDYLVGVTDVPEGKRKRKFEKSLVTKIGEVELPSYLIVTDDGKEIVASEDHRWLASRWKAITAWRRTDCLKVGDVIRCVTDVWDQPDPLESGWIGGMLDGDGSAETGSGLRVAIIQNPGPVLNQVTEILSRWGIDYTAACRYNGKKGKWGSKRDGRAFTVRTKNTRNAMKLLGMAPSVRLGNRWEGVAFPLGRGKIKSKIIRIEPIGIRKLIGMKTSTGTFVAEGLASHNTDDPWVSEKRKSLGFKDITLWEHEAYHQWHTRMQYWMAQDKAPYWNKGGHTIDNLLGDPDVPPGGTCEIWDAGSYLKQDAQERADALAQRGAVEATGFKPR